ncbi:tRNA:m(4)X modification enzyme TRM13 homolog isoform 2-T3 [Spinachia spinachia]
MQRPASPASVSSNMAAARSGRCGFFVEKKKRFCKMIVAKGKVFCGEHANMEEGSSRRIPCPLDPKHTVSEDKLDKHLKKCNSREKAKPVYYVENINSGSTDGETLEQVSLSERSRAELQSLLDKLKSAVTGGTQRPKERRLRPQTPEAAVLPLRSPGGARAAGKRAVLRGVWSRSRKTIPLDPRSSEEPRPAADLRRPAAAAGGAQQHPLQDGKHQHAGVQFERLQVDIQYLDLSKVQLLRQKRLPLVGVGKHLCGAATDLALRCLLKTPRPAGEAEPPRKRLKTSEQEEPPLAESGLGPGPVLGLAVALCCHHRCEWRHYVGQQFFLQRGLGAAEFSAFCRMSSWATCGLRVANQDHDPQARPGDGDDEEEHEPAEETDAVSGFLSAEERERVGRLCKRLIDSGRLHFLETRGFRGKLARYANSQVTLENVVLTAVPSPPSWRTN